MNNTSQTANPSKGSGPARIVESHSFPSSKSPRNTGPTKRVNAEFEGVPEGCPQAVPQVLNDGQSWQTTPGLLDDEYHEQLSDRLGIHRATPAWSVPCTEAAMRLWLKEIGITQEHYLRVTALRSLADFIELNPKWSLRAWVGTVFEMKAEELGVL